MHEDSDSSGSYDADGVDQLEAIWGDGFMSPGGAGEVARIVVGAGVADADVLDIGCGTGGAALALAVEHHPRSVTGIDVEPFVVSRATARKERGQDERVRFLVVELGPLPFADGFVDVVFSKDAIIHVQNKEALLGEAYRVLRSGGRLCVGDWLRGAGDELDPLVERFTADSGEEFYMQTLSELSALVSAVGFADVEAEDRCDWYAKEAQNELARLRGSLREPFLLRFPQDFYDATVQFWESVVAATRRGVLRPRTSGPASRSTVLLRVRGATYRGEWHTVVWPTVNPGEDWVTRALRAVDGPGAHGLPSILRTGGWSYGGGPGLRSVPHRAAQHARYLMRSGSVVVPRHQNPGGHGPGTRSVTQRPGTSLSL